MFFEAKPRQRYQAVHKLSPTAPSSPSPPTDPWPKHEPWSGAFFPRSGPTGPSERLGGCCWCRLDVCAGLWGVCVTSPMTSNRKKKKEKKKEKKKTKKRKKKKNSSQQYWLYRASVAPRRAFHVVELGLTSPVMRKRRTGVFGAPQYVKGWNGWKGELLMIVWVGSFLPGTRY